jgi:hypothetical protein
MPSTGQRECADVKQACSGRLRMFFPGTWGILGSCPLCVALPFYWTLQVHRLFGQHQAG